MTATPDAPDQMLTPRATWRDAFAVYLQPRVLIVMFLGFSSGLPLALSGSTLLVWVSENGVNLGTIGLFTLVGTPYTLKFLWAPLVDGLPIPLLTRWLGRRRGWLVFTQLMLMAAISGLALTDPAKSPFYVALGALLVATASATQDIVVDAYRIESLPENEQAAGMASYVAAYRVGMVASTAGALFIVTGFEAAGLARLQAWMASFAVMAGLVTIGIVTVLLAKEPVGSQVADDENDAKPSLRRVAQAAITAFTDFLSQRDAVAVLIFVMLFKFTDAFAGAMTVPFIIDMGFTRNDYAIIVKGVGLAATLVGGFAGGFLARAVPLIGCLWIGGLLQAVSNLTFTWLALVGPQQWALTVAVAVESFTGAIGTVIFVAYLSALCNNPLHTATQYALLTALASVGRIYLSSGAGYVAGATGWPLFFVVSVLVAIPSLILLVWLQARGHFKSLGSRPAAP